MFPHSLESPFAPFENQPRIARVSRTNLFFLSVSIRENPWPILFLLLVLHVHVLGVDHAFVFLLALAVAAGVAACGCTRSWTCPRRRLRRFIHLLGQLMRSLGQRLARLVHGCLIVRL